MLVYLLHWRSVPRLYITPRGSQLAVKRKLVLCYGRTACLRRNWIGCSVTRCFAWSSAFAGMLAGIFSVIHSSGSYMEGAIPCTWLWTPIRILWMIASDAACPSCDSVFSDASVAQSSCAVLRSRIKGQALSDWVVTRNWAIAANRIAVSRS